jgi:hypothetical protein
MSDHCEETRALDRYEPSRSIVRNVSDLQALGTALASSGMFGKCSPGKGLVIWTICDQKGIDLLRFLQTYHVTDRGQISMRADRAYMNYRKLGGTLVWDEYSKTRAAARFTYAEFKELPIEYTIKEAIEAELVRDGSQWKKDPGAMLRARVLTRGIRMVCPEALDGFYTPEELEIMESIEPTPPDTKPQWLARGAPPDTKPTRLATAPPAQPAQSKSTKQAQASPAQVAAEAVADVLDGEILPDDKSGDAPDSAPDYSLCPIPGKMLGIPWSEMSDKHLQGALKSRNGAMTEEHRDAVRAVIKERDELPF